MIFDIITDKRRISKNKGIQLFQIEVSKYMVFVSAVKKSKIISLKKAQITANKILKKRLKRLGR
jgi:hypothetical protein